MRRRVLFILMMIGLACPMLQAQHYVGAMVDGAAAWQFDREENAELTTPKLGGGASVGGVYQYQYDKFLVQMGLGASQVWLRQGLDTLPIERAMNDTEGFPFTYYGSLTNRIDQVMVTELMVPVMLGTKIRSFHVLVGAKFAATILGFTSQTAALTTWGDYGDRYYGPLEHMPQHGFYDGKEVASQDTMSFRPDVRLCAELGWSWALTKEPVKIGAPVLQVGAFVEYGILNPLKRMNNTSLLSEDFYNPYMDVKMNHVYTTMNREQTVINNLRVGLRVAVLFPVAEGRNPFCRCIDGAATRYSL